MTTTKKRINITLPEDLELQLKFISKRDLTPIATKAVELLKKAIDIEEDDTLNQIAENRDEKTANFISHDNAWG